MSDHYSSTKMMVLGALLLGLQLHACQSPSLPLPSAPVGQVQKLDLSDPKFLFPIKAFVTLSVTQNDLFISTPANTLIRYALTQPVKTFEYKPDYQLISDTLPVFNKTLLAARGFEEGKLGLWPPSLGITQDDGRIKCPRNFTPSDSEQIILPTPPQYEVDRGYNFSDGSETMRDPCTEAMWIDSLSDSGHIYISSFSGGSQPLVLAQTFTISKENPRETLNHKRLDSLWINQDFESDFEPISMIQGMAVGDQGKVYFNLADQHSVYRTKFTMLERIAGQPGQSGYVDGKAEDARFEAPRAIEVDTQGNVYVLEADKSRVRKITPDGTVSTLAGGAEAGYADGKGSQAKFNKPFDLAVSARGDVYVSDTGNNRIRKITPDGTVSTLIGTGEEGVSEGEPLKSKVGYPLGIDISPDGTLYYISAGSMDSLYYSTITPPKFTGAVLRFKLAD